MVSPKTLPGFAFLALAAGPFGCGSSSSPGGGADAGADVDAAPPEPDAGGGSATADACNPLGEMECLLPWPSAAYLEDDPGTETGLRVALPEAAMPRNRYDVAISPAPYNRHDGFGFTGPILAAFPGGVSGDGLPGAGDIGASVADDAPIVLLDMDTGERHPYLAEVDHNAFSNAPGQRALIIRPMEALRPDTRYAVAIRDTVTSADGGALPVPEAFRAIRAGETPAHPRAAALAPRYPAVFAALEDAGVDRGELVLAWDFVTASNRSLTADLRSMRAQAIDAIGPGGAGITYQLMEVPDDSALTLRLVAGTFASPNFLSNGEEDDSVLVRGEDQLPVLDGTYPANLSAIVPECARTAELPLPTLVFGHGLFGSSAAYLQIELLKELANDRCAVVVASDWIGLTQRQTVLAALVSGDAGRIPQITEKLAQSVINFIILEHAVRGPLGDSPLFQVDGQSMLDPEEVYYYGVSLGGIMGGVFMAYDPAIERGALGVPGGAWSMLLERSYAWNGLQGTLINAYGDQLTYQAVIGLMGLAFDPYDPMTTARRVIDDPLPDTPPKQLLVYEAVGDSLVSNLTTNTLARTLGIPLTGPSVVEPYGLEVADQPVESGLTIYDQGFEPLPPVGNVPPEEDNGTHSDVNKLDAVVRQLEALFLDGVVTNECTIDGAPAPCDCTTDAC